MYITKVQTNQSKFILISFYRFTSDSANEICEHRLNPINMNNSNANWCEIDIKNTGSMRRLVENFNESISAPLIC